jgi:hypothetical protein
MTTLDTEKGQGIREKTGAQNIVKEIKQYQKKWLYTYRGWTQTEYQKKHYNIEPKGRMEHTSRTTEEQLEGPTSS